MENIDPNAPLDIDHLRTWIGKTQASSTRSPYVPLEAKRPLSDTLRPQPLYVGDKVANYS